MNSFMRVEEVAKELDVSISFAYKVIKMLNSQLENLGYVTISGRVSRQYFSEKLCYINQVAMVERKNNVSI